MRYNEQSMHGGRRSRPHGREAVCIAGGALRTEGKGPGVAGPGAERVVRCGPENLVIVRPQETTPANHETEEGPRVGQAHTRARHKDAMTRARAPQRPNDAHARARAPQTPNTTLWGQESQARTCTGCPDLSSGQTQKRKHAGHVRWAPCCSDDRRECKASHCACAGSWAGVGGQRVTLFLAQALRSQVSTSPHPPTDRDRMEEGGTPGWADRLRPHITVGTGRGRTHGSK